MRMPRSWPRLTPQARHKETRLPRPCSRPIGGIFHSCDVPHIESKSKKLTGSLHSGRYGKGWFLRSFPLFTKGDLQGHLPYCAAEGLAPGHHCSLLLRDVETRRAEPVGQRHLGRDHGVQIALDSKWLGDNENAAEL